MPPNEAPQNVSPRVGLSRCWTFGLAAILCLALTLRFLYPLYQSNILFVPPEPGDGPDYDNLALNLAQGHGFGFEWNDSEWRSPYLRYQADPSVSALLKRQGDFEPSAYRPPAYPMFLAAVYKILGHNFAWPRIFQALLFAVSLTAIAFAALPISGWLGPLLMLVASCFDGSFILWSQSYYAEALSAALVTLLFIQLARADFRQHALYLGLLTGLLVLTKSMFVVWLPFCIGSVVVVSRNFKLAGIFLLGFLLLIAPWALRNQNLTGEFLPLGTQSGPNLAYDYSDTAIQAKGVWLGRFNLPLISPFYEEHPDLRGIQLEVELSRWGTEKASQWIAEHSPSLPNLVGLKLSSFWWRDTLGFQKILVLMALFGLWVAKKQPRIFAVSSTLLLAQTVTVGLTHNVPAGRFLIPLYPVLYFLAALAIGTLGRKAGAWLRLPRGEDRAHQ